MIDFNDYIPGLEFYQKSCEELLEYYSQPEHYYETILTASGAVVGLITPAIVGLLATKAIGETLPSFIAQQLGAYAGAFAIPIAHTYVYSAGVTEYSQAAIGKTVTHSLYASAAKSADYNKMQAHIAVLNNQINTQIQPAITAATNALVGLARQVEQTNAKIEICTTVSQLVALNQAADDLPQIPNAAQLIINQIDILTPNDAEKLALKRALESLLINPEDGNNIDLNAKMNALNIKAEQLKEQGNYEVLVADGRPLDQIQGDLDQIEQHTQQAQTELETQQTNLQTAQEEITKIQALRPGWISGSWSKTLWMLNAGTITYFTYIKAKQGVDLIAPIGKYLDQRSAQDANFDLSTFLTESLKTLPETLNDYALCSGLDIPVAWNSIKTIIKSTAQVVAGPVYEDYNTQWITPAIIAYKQTCTSIAHKLNSAADALMPPETQEKRPLKTEL